jgi:hypothetical protein
LLHHNGYSHAYLWKTVAILQIPVVEKHGTESKPKAIIIGGD